MSKATAAARANAATIAADTAASPQSQIALMSGNVATVNPQGDTALFVRADVQGKEHAQTFRLHVISTAVLELLKGNPRNLKEAVELVAQLGKGKKARAYAAGFAAIADAKPLTRTGKWMDSVNAALRTEADTLTAAYVAQFASAHATVMAEKAAPKAKKEPAPAPQASAEGDTADTASTDGADDVVIDSATLIESALATVVTLVQQGMLDADQMATLRAALAQHDVDTGTVPGVMLVAATSAQPALAH